MLEGASAAAPLWFYRPSGHGSARCGGLAESSPGGALERGRIYGRGASDMKSGLAAMTAAVLRLAETSRERAADVILIFTAGEETGSEGAFRMVRDGVFRGESELSWSVTLR